MGVVPFTLKVYFYPAEYGRLTIFFSHTCAVFFWKYLLWETKGDKSTDFHSVTELGMRCISRSLRRVTDFFGAS